MKKILLVGMSIIAATVASAQTATTSDRVSVKSAREVYSELTDKGLSMTFSNVHQEGSRVVGNVSVDWDEDVFGNRVVLIRQEFPFSIDQRTRLFETSIGIGWGISVKVYGDIYIEAPNRVCLDVRAEWPGGNVGDRRCSFFIADLRRAAH